MQSSQNYLVLAHRKRRTSYELSQAQAKQKKDRKRITAESIIYEQLVISIPAVLMADAVDLPFNCMRCLHLDVYKS